MVLNQSSFTGIRTYWCTNNRCWNRKIKKQIASFLEFFEWDCDITCENIKFFKLLS